MNVATPWLLWLDTAHDPAWNMAADEWLGRLATGRQATVVRCYAWTSQAVTFGYFQPYSAAAGPGAAAVRRPTAGGRVEHGSDFTFSLACPRGQWLAELRATAGYAAVNTLVRDALRAAGVACALYERELPPDVDRARLVCFATPARHDVVAPDGAKLCGGAQRRSLRGLLYQGSVALNRLPNLARPTLAAALQAALAAHFGAPPTPWQPAPADAEAIAALARTRYASAGWNRRR